MNERRIKERAASEREGRPTRATERLEDVLLLQTVGSRRPVPMAEIAYLESDGEASRIRLREGETLRDRRSMKTLETLLRGHGFLRVHRGCIVNLRQILEIRRRRHGRDWEIVLRPPSEATLLVARTYLSDLWAAFGD